MENPFLVFIGESLARFTLYVECAKFGLPCNPYWLDFEGRQYRSMTEIPGEHGYLVTNLGFGSSVRILLRAEDLTECAWPDASSTEPRAMLRTAIRAEVQAAAVRQAKAREGRRRRLA